MPIYDTEEPRISSAKKPCDLFRGQGFGVAEAFEEVGVLLGDWESRESFFEKQKRGEGFMKNLTSGAFFMRHGWFY